MDKVKKIRIILNSNFDNSIQFIHSSSTDSDAVFSGTMQLMASIKCCTARRLTNHPHFEDKMLRDVTKQVYQIYAMQTPQIVYEALKNIGSDYVVVENSICYSGSKPGGCSLKEIIDIDDQKLGKTDQGRFCDKVRHNLIEYGKYFQLAFENKIFRVYKLQ